MIFSPLLHDIKWIIKKNTSQTWTKSMEISSSKLFYIMISKVLKWSVMGNTTPIPIKQY